jgi:transcriptional regulatory protein RtcR
VVVIGLLGTNLDRGGKQRWDRWRPSIDLCRHEDFLIDRFELLHEQPRAGERGLDWLVEQVVADIGQVSPETLVREHAIAWPDPWDFEGVYAALLDFARSYPFAPDDEDYLVHITTGTHVAQICLFLLTESRELPGRLLQSSPPGRGQPPNAPGTLQIIDLDLSKYDRLASRFAERTQRDVSFLKAGIATKSPRFNALIERIERVVLASAAPILLGGPTGAGKTRLARRIYELRRERRMVEGAFVEVNCATLRGDIAMSALFGHEKGAFTGAATRREGLLVAADRGVLFLDEIGELGLDEQAMLLRAIEDRRFMPLGSERELQSDFQLIAGTNRDLREQVAAGRFREDLLARIDLWTFELPALRERAEDIEPNLDYELERWAARTGTRVTLSREARERFLAFARSSGARWPGNFRDFAAAVERMATLAAGGRIDVGLVEDEIARLTQQWAPRATSRGPEALLARYFTPAELAELDRFDRSQLADVLAVCRASESLAEAGRELFSASRARRGSTNDGDRLRKYLARFELTFAKVKALE